MAPVIPCDIDLPVIVMHNKCILPNNTCVCMGSNLVRVSLSSCSDISDPTVNVRTTLAPLDYTRWPVSQLPFPFLLLTACWRVRAGLVLLLWSASSSPGNAWLSSFFAIWDISAFMVRLNSSCVGPLFLFWALLLSPPLFRPPLPPPAAAARFKHNSQSPFFWSCENLLCSFGL